MLPPNRAVELLQRIQRKAIERAQISLLPPFAAQAVLALGLLALALISIPIGIYVGVLVAGQVLISALVVATMARLDSVIAGGLMHAWLVRAAQMPVVTFTAREWHIVGAEE